MKLQTVEIALTERAHTLRTWLNEDKRLGLITSIDGGQLITLVLDPADGSAQCWQSDLKHNHYPALTPTMPQCHWFERSLLDLFGLYADGHPRMKPALLHDEYAGGFLPLRTSLEPITFDITKHLKHQFLTVQGMGVYEIPVGPIHAGIIEPGHFRLSCLGEIILNLELRLGYLHRGIEKRLCEVPWQKARFVAESAASDTAVANALAHAQAIESLFELGVPERAKYLRSLALEVERISMHIIDIGGMAVDLGFLGIASSMARMRGKALRLGELLSGSRFQRGYICPGGVVRDPDARLAIIARELVTLRSELEPIISMFIENPAVLERMSSICTMSKSLANEFGLVGLAARACGIAYDTRQSFVQGIFPEYAPKVACENSGDVLARTWVRIAELFNSLVVCGKLLDSIKPGPVLEKVPDTLPADSIGVGIVEAFRGELIHLVFTDQDGKIKRYAIKDPSFNNWTGVAIAIRNNLVADFPVGNKSFSLSYSGHDL